MLPRWMALVTAQSSCDDLGTDDLLRVRHCDFRAPRGVEHQPLDVAAQLAMSVPARSATSRAAAGSIWTGRLRPPPASPAPRPAARPGAEIDARVLGSFEPPAFDDRRGLLQLLVEPAASDRHPMRRGRAPWMAPALVRRPRARPTRGAASSSSAGSASSALPRRFGLSSFSARSTTTTRCDAIIGSSRAASTIDGGGHDCRVA